MTSVATKSFAWALDYLAEWEPDDRERRVGFDLAPFAPPSAVVERTPGEAVQGKIAEAAERLADGSVTSVELVEQALERVTADNDRLVGYVELIADSARSEAAALDAERAAGRVRGPLHGIPISVKDVIHVAGATTRCGSEAFEALPEQDAWAVARARAAGAIVLGKVSTHEFALGVTSPQSRNPHDDTRIPGGSSGGSAVTVATEMCLASICTDTRASSRVPAALSGIVGFKPTYGTIPTRGVVPLSWTMDHVGVIAPRVADAATMLDLLRDLPPCLDGAGESIAELSIGLPRFAFDDVDPEVAASIAASVEDLRSSGARLDQLDTPAEADFVGANAGGMITSRCEAATFHRGLNNDRGLYWAEVRDQLNAADQVLATDYLQAQRFRAWLRERMLAVFEGVDALVMPTVPVLAPPVEDAEDYLTILSRNAILWSFVGFPAISVPARPAPNGLPVGLQVVAAPYAERTLVAVATAVEAAVAADR